MSEKELSVQVTEVNSVEIDNVNFAEAGKDEVFQKLAADTTSANQEDARLRIEAGTVSIQPQLIAPSYSILYPSSKGTYLLDLGGQVDSKGALDRAGSHDGGRTAGWRDQSQRKSAGYQGVSVIMSIGSRYHRMEAGW
jgi:hypothetical protein